MLCVFLREGKLVNRAALSTPLLSPMECPVPLLLPLPAWERAGIPHNKALIHWVDSDMAAPSRFLGGQ